MPCANHPLESDRRFAVSFSEDLACIIKREITNFGGCRGAALEEFVAQLLATLLAYAEDKDSAARKLRRVFDAVECLHSEVSDFTMQVTFEDR